jgi:hypothetical protein
MEERKKKRAVYFGDYGLLTSEIVKAGYAHKKAYKGLCEVFQKYKS